MNIFDRLRRGIVTTSPEEMMEVATAVAGVCPPNATLELSGDLGAGKTVFVKGLARAWNVRETVTSPTFTIFAVYAGDRNLIHMDAYRLESSAEMEALMIEEFLSPPYCLAVEWPEKIADWLPKDSWRLAFTIGQDRTHTVRMLHGP